MVEKQTPISFQYDIRKTVVLLNGAPAWISSRPKHRIGWAGMMLILEE